MNSPRISVNGDTFGFENALFDLIDEIVEETRKFVIERKSAQLDMFDSVDESESRSPPLGENKEMKVS